MITFPVAVGMLVVADPFFPMVLGEKWRGMLAPFQVLALYGSIQSVAPLVTQILVVTKQTRFQMWASLCATAVLVAGFVIGSRWGTVGIAAVWLVVYPFTLVRH